MPANKEPKTEFFYPDASAEDIRAGVARFEERADQYIPFMPCVFIGVLPTTAALRAIMPLMESNGGIVIGSDFSKISKKDGIEIIETYERVIALMKNHLEKM